MSSAPERLNGSLRRAIAIFKERSSMVPLVMVLDGLFFFVAGIILSALGSATVRMLQAAGSSVVERSASIQSQDTLFSLIKQDPLLREALLKALALLLLLVLVLVLVFAMIEGMAWAITAGWMVDLDKRRFLWRFTKASLLQSPIFFLWVAALYAARLSERLGSTASPRPALWIIAGLLIILHLLYVTKLVDHSPLMALRRAASTLASGYASIALAVILVLITLVVVDFVIGIALTLDQAFGTILGIVLVLGSFTFIRLMVLELTGDRDG